MPPDSNHTTDEPTQFKAIPGSVEARMPIALRPLRHRDFALLWGASLVSNIGTWIETIAIGSLIAKDTGKATAVGLAAAAAFLPSAILSPIGGVISDRFHRKRFLMATLSFDTALAVLLVWLVATGHTSPGLLSFILFLEGCSGALSLPNRQSLMPELVPKEDLLAAVSLGSAAWNGGRVIGPMFAGLIIRYGGGTTAAIIANAISFAVMLLATSQINLPERPIAKDSESVFSRIRVGFTAIRTQPQCRLAAILIMLLAATAGPFIGLLPIVAHNVFHGDATTTALFVSAQGVGAVIGALSAPSLAIRVGRERAILTFMVLLVPSLLVYALAPSKYVAAACLIVIGGSYMGAFAGMQGLLQLNAPSPVKARVLSLFSVAIGLSYTIAVSVNGVLADRIGLRQTGTLQSASLAAALVLLSITKPGWWRQHVTEISADAEGNGVNSATIDTGIR